MDAVPTGKPQVIRRIRMLEWKLVDNVLGRYVQLDLLSLQAVNEDLEISHGASWLQDEMHVIAKNHMSSQAFSVSRFL